MGISDLKEKAYALAAVTTTQQLKAKYEAIASLNFRFKASWQSAIAFLETNPPGDRQAAKTRATLKTEVYSLAEVSTTQQLKSKYKALRSLNFSFRDSWEQALALLNSANQQNFQAWLANPPEEYRALFAEIEAVSDTFDTKFEKAKHLGNEAQKIAASLEQLAQFAQEESDHLRQEADIAYQTAQQAKLN